MKTWELQGPLSAPSTYWLLMIWKRMEHCQIWANLTWMLQRVKSSEPDLQRSCWWNNGFVIDTGLNWKGYIAQLCVCVCAPDTYEKGSQVERKKPSQTPQGLFLQIGIRCPCLTTCCWGSPGVQVPQGFCVFCNTPYYLKSCCEQGVTYITDHDEESYNSLLRADFALGPSWAK